MAVASRWLMDAAPCHLHCRRTMWTPTVEQSAAPMPFSLITSVVANFTPLCNVAGRAACCVQSSTDSYSILFDLAPRWKTLQRTRTDREPSRPPSRGSIQPGRELSRRRSRARTTKPAGTCRNWRLKKTNDEVADTSDPIASGFLLHALFAGNIRRKITRITSTRCSPAAPSSA